MDLQAAKALNARMWLIARFGFGVCFGLAGLLLAASLFNPATGHGARQVRSSVHMSFSPQVVPPT